MAPRSGILGQIPGILGQIPGILDQCQVFWTKNLRRSNKVEVKFSALIPPCRQKPVQAGMWDWEAAPRGAGVEGRGRGGKGSAEAEC